MLLPMNVEEEGLTMTRTMPARGLEPELFDTDAVAVETARFNEALVERLAGGPDIWTLPISEVRAARAAGRGTFPLCPPDPDARIVTIEGRHGPIDLRIMHPKSGLPRGTYLHIHGGGWIMGTARENDERLRMLAEATGLSTISVDYRLAPEHPYPQAPDDCESAILWMLGEGRTEFNHDFLAIGGESAGAHLSVVCLVRLRDRHGISPFSAALLTAGCYDLELTPSVRNWGERKLVLNSRDVEAFVRHFLAGGADASTPDVSPIQADLSGLPPALFTCGTADLLLDDTLFMAARWTSFGNSAETAIYPGGCHVFQAFDLKIAHQSLRQMESFLNIHIDAGASRTAPRQVRSGTVSSGSEAPKSR
jgi:acetyl esterase